MQYAIGYAFDAPYSQLYSCSMDISSRLDMAMKEAGFSSQSALSRASGVPQPTINRILKRVGTKGPEAETIRKLAAACHVSFDWLNEGIGPKRRAEGPSVGTYQEHANYGRRATDIAGGIRVVGIDNDAENPQVSRIRKVKLKLSAGIVGFSVEPEEEYGNPIFFRRDWLATRGLKAENLIAVGVKGPSMEPGMYDGDTVVVNTADTIPRDGEVYAVNYEGECVIKRLIRDAGLWWLSSDNPDQRRFPRKECSGDMCLIIGKVIHKQSERI